MILDHSIVCPILVGRAAHAGTVRGTLARARQESAGAALVLSGEAGVGKTRLLRVAAESAREQGFLVLTGASFEEDRALPFAPLLDLVRSYATSASPAVVAHTLAPAASELLALAPELRRVFPDDEPAPPTDPEHGRRRLFNALLLAMQQLARRQALLLVFEDVHWSDDASLDLLLHLARGTASHPVVLALSHRPEESGPRLRRLLAELDRTRTAVELPLQRLAAADVAAMVDAIFGARAAPGEAFTAALHDLTDGNPFFVEEVLKALVVAGDLAPDGEGRWRVRPLERMHVPRSAVEAVKRRLAQLEPRTRELAGVAAVAGRRFDFALLQALSGCTEGELLPSVRELVDAQLVVEETADRIAFRHALTREAIYGELLVRERVQLHRRIADALERLHADAPDDVLGMLAYHAFEARDWLRAREYCARAADHALALFAPREALEHLDHAMDAGTRAGEPVDPGLQLARGRALETLGEFEAAHADFAAVLETARAAGARETEWQALHELGMLWAARDYSRAGEYRRAALALARAIGDRSRIARSLNRVGNWHVNLEQPAAARRYHEEALQLMEQAGDDRGVAETVDLLAMAAHMAGDEVDAVLYYERAVTFFNALGNRRGLAAAQALIALCGPSHHCSCTTFGHSDQTEEVLDTLRPIVLTQEIGWRAGEAFCRFVLADCLAWRGAYERALPAAQAALVIAEELEHLEWQAGASRVLGVLALDLGALDRAVSALEQAHAIALRLGSRAWTRWCAAPLASALVQAGRAREALVLLEAAEAPATLGRDLLLPGEELAVTLGERHLRLARAEALLAQREPEAALRVLDACTREEQARAARNPGRVVTSPAGAVALPRHTLLRARALLVLADHDAAEAAFRLALEEATATHSPPLQWRALAGLGQVHRARRQRVEARGAFDAARRVAGQLASRIEGDALRVAFQALVDAAAPPPAQPSPGQAAKAAHGGLTRRERQVAGQVAQGKSNRAIANTLGISERTVEDHVTNALARLQFSSRTQLAAWAVRQGLAEGPST